MLRKEANMSQGIHVPSPTENQLEGASSPVGYKDFGDIDIWVNSPPIM